MKRMWEKVKETWREFWFVYEDEEDSTQHLSRSDKQSIWCGLISYVCVHGGSMYGWNCNRVYP